MFEDYKNENSMVISEVERCIKRNSSYIIAHCECYKDLEMVVNYMIDKGYLPVGGVNITGTGIHRVCDQALLKHGN